MERKSNPYLCVIGIFAALIFSHCENARKYDFICQNTMSIDISNNGKNYYFSIPVQYIGDYQIEAFDFINGYILIGDYKILLEKENVKITILLNNQSDVYENTGNDLNQYNINIERTLSHDEIENIINEYKNLNNTNYKYRKGNTNSKINIEYKLTTDKDGEFETGMFDYFEFIVLYE